MPYSLMSMPNKKVQLLTQSLPSSLSIWHLFSWKHERPHTQQVFFSVGTDFMTIFFLYRKYRCKHTKFPKCEYGVWEGTTALKELNPHLPCDVLANRLLCSLALSHSVSVAFFAMLSLPSVNTLFDDRFSSPLCDKLLMGDSDFGIVMLLVEWWRLRVLDIFDRWLPRLLFAWVRHESLFQSCLFSVATMNKWWVSWDFWRVNIATFSSKLSILVFESSDSSVNSSAVTVPAESDLRLLFSIRNLRFSSSTAASLCCKCWHLSFIVWSATWSAKCEPTASSTLFGLHGEWSRSLSFFSRLILSTLNYDAHSN